jgi:hypothetical protein
MLCYLADKAAPAMFGKPVCILGHCLYTLLLLIGIWSRAVGTFSVHPALSHTHLGILYLAGSDFAQVVACSNAHHEQNILD